MCIKTEWGVCCVSVEVPDSGTLGAPDPVQSPGHEEEGGWGPNWEKGLSRISPVTPSITLDLSPRPPRRQDQVPSGGGGEDG